MVAAASASPSGAEPGRRRTTPTTVEGEEGFVRLTAWVDGRVQGVGFRWWVRSRALELGLVGTATNLDDGRVQVVAQGRRESAEALLAALRGPETPGRVVSVTERWSSPQQGLSGFQER